MKQIFQIVNQNREEAIELVKKNGGCIDAFVACDELFTEV